MKNIISLALMLLSITAFSQTGNLEGKWISESETPGGEVVAYEFFDDNTLKMYFDDKELPTKEPIKFRINEKNNRMEIVLEYVSPWNNSTEKMTGLIEFLNDEKIKMELFSLDGQHTQTNDFSEDVMTFKRI